MDFTGERYVPNLDSPEISYEHWHRYLYATQFVKGKVVLDIACGEGYGSDLLAKTAKKVVGVDISKEVVTYVWKTYKKDNLKFLVGSVANIPVEGKGVFDVIVSFETIEHVGEDEQKRFLGEVKRLLKPNGVFICSTPDKKTYSDLLNYKNEFHVKEFYKDEYENFLKEYFKNVSVFGQKIWTASYIWEDGRKVKNFMEFGLEYHDGGFSPSDKKKDLLYLVAVCSDHEVTNGDFSVLTDMSNGIIEGKNKLISRLNNELEDKTKWAQDLDKEIARYREISEGLRIELEDKTKWAQDLDKEIARYREISEGLRIELEDKTKWAQDLDKEIARYREISEGLRIELEDKTKWAQDLDKEIARYREISEGLRIELEDKTKWAQDLDKEIEKHKEVLDRLKGLMKRKEEEVSMLNEVVGGRDRKIEELNTYLRFRDSEVLALRSSYSFRIGRLFVLPVSSVMEFFKKTWVGLMVSLNFFRHPINFIKKLSFDNVRRFFSALKTESRVSVLGNVKRFLAKNGRNFLFDSAELQLFPVQNYNKKIVFEKVDSPVVSIIIPVYNQWDYTYSCLLSILENTKGIDYEVIIADDVSLDETKNINKYVKNVVVVRNEINLGFLRNCKNSARHAKGQYLIFLNNDTNAQGGWLRSLLDVFESDDRVGLVGSKLVYPNGKLQEAGGIIWKNGTGWNYGKTQDPSMPEFNYVKEVDYISGASIMIKTDLWKEIGGFDERYERAYFEDGDLAFEVRKHGYKVIYQPKSVVVHFEGVSCGTSEQSGEKSYQKKNRETFVNKWKDVLEKDNFNPGENVFLARDKSGHKKTILVIDHYVPHFDKDAGSKTMFQYLKLFAEMGMNVKFMGDNFYKHEPYTSILQQAGVEVLYGNWFAKEWRNWLKENGHCFDYVYLNRSSVSVKYIDFVKEFTGAKIIYNAVDFSYLRLQRQYELTGDESLKSAVKEAKKQEYYIFERSDIIITISDFEKKLLERDFDGKSVYVIPTYIYDDVFLNQDFPGYDERRDILFVGGFAHGPNVDAISWFVKEIFSNIEKDLPGVKLNIIGSNPPEEVLRLKSGKINILGFVPEEELKKYYLNSKLILAPLRFGAGVKGKIIEAISYNVPVITTSIGAEGIERGNEFLVVGNNANTFAKNIIAVYKDERKWHKINVSEKKYAREYLSKDRAGKIFSKIFNL